MNGIDEMDLAGRSSHDPSTFAAFRSTSGSVNMSLAIEIPFQGRAGAASDRPTGVAGGATQGVTALAGPLTACGAFAAPDERRRVRVPAVDRRGEPGHHLLGRLGMLAGQGTPDDDPLDRLGQVQPGAA